MTTITQEDIRKVVEIEMTTWGEIPGDTVPDHLLTAISREGGVLLGAYQDNSLIGFTLGWLGTKNPAASIPAINQLKLVSHMTAVLSEYRDQRIGYKLKLAQRYWAFEQGLDLITWTYDPLESRNGYFNIHLLGTTCNTYMRDYYGEMSDKLSGGIPSDRFRVDWFISDQADLGQVSIGKTEYKTIDPLLKAGVLLVNPSLKNAAGIHEPAEHPAPFSNKKILVEIPSDFQLIRKKDLGLALSWRLHTREIFEGCFQNGYRVIDFIHQRHPDRRSYYLLDRIHED